MLLSLGPIPIKSTAQYMGGKPDSAPREATKWGHGLWRKVPSQGSCSPLTLFNKLSPQEKKAPPLGTDWDCSAVCRPLWLSGCLR